MALLPTGGGKSVCFQVPGLILEGITIVISPLIALMKDQVEQLKERGIKATAIYSGLNKTEIDIILDNCIYGDIKFLYVSPERLKTEIFKERARKMNISLIAVDEAHCISLWGFDFRPPYLEIPEFREIVPEAPLIALTATATADVQKDIIERLELKNPLQYSQSFARENISYSVRKVLNKKEKLLEIVQRIPGTGIVYVNSRKEAKEIAYYLIQHSISADFYHAGLGGQVRSMKQDAWIKGKLRIIVATNAFGMGIDKPDVRLVVHMEIPLSPEAYYQEAGRAGRDGAKSYSVILYHDKDADDLKKHVEVSNPSPEYLKRVYQSLANFLSVAEGASENASYDFDIREFCQHFEYKYRPAYFAIKKLETEGLIQLNEAFQNPSKVWVLLNKQDLYKFQIQHSKFDILIKTILRLYGGEMLSQLTKISEGQIANSLETNIESIVNSLRDLQNMGVVDYDEQKDKPQLLFLSQRYDAKNLPIDAKAIKKRMRNEYDKIDAMISYVRNSQRCRSQILLDYFGEASFLHCGICDTCLEQKHHDDVVHHSQYTEQILHILQEKPLYIEELIHEIEPEKEDEFQIIVREMIDKGQIRYNESWQITLK